MSKIFYDYLVELNELDSIIKNSVDGSDEKEELWQIIDEMIHHKLLGCILDRLPEEHHHDFLEKFYECPYDQNLIEFINNLIDERIEDVIKDEIDILKNEILNEVLEKTPKKIKAGKRTKNVK